MNLFLYGLSGPFIAGLMESDSASGAFMVTSLALRPPPAVALTHLDDRVVAAPRCCGRGAGFGNIGTGTMAPVLRGLWSQFAGSTERWGVVLLLVRQASRHPAISCPAPLIRLGGWCASAVARSVRRARGGAAIARRSFWRLVALGDA